MRVLVVEDDDDIAVVISEALRAVGYDVDRSPDGADGLWRAREGIYGVIVLDLLLPKMNGFTVCESLRAAGIDTPVLMLTARAGHLDEIDGFEAGADDYLRKPFEPAVLQARVKGLLRRATPGTQREQLVRGSIAFDPSTHQCTVDANTVSLTGRQSQLLEALLRSGDQPISRLGLLRSVWGMDFEGDPNVVDVYLGYLRKHLGRDTIENIRGVGFRIRA